MNPYYLRKKRYQLLIFSNCMLMSYRSFSRKITLTRARVVKCRLLASRCSETMGTPKEY